MKKKVLSKTMKRSPADEHSSSIANALKITLENSLEL